MLHSRTCRGGMVTAPHHLAAQAGVGVLREGGSAVEAMVAAAAAIAVVYPHMNGIGGDGFWLISEPGCDPVGIQACGPTAALAVPEDYTARGEASIPARGPRAALTVAGAVGGWAVALDHARRWGRTLPLPRLLEDAIRHARAGMPMTPSLVAMVRSKWHELEHVPGFAATFAAAVQSGAFAMVSQPALGATLERLADAGMDDFYRGDIARSLAADLEHLGAPLRLPDLEAYRAKRVSPLSVDLRCGRVFNLPPPTQGVASLMILGLFDRLAVTDAESVAHIHGLVEATKCAFRWRNLHVGDPAFMTVSPHDCLTVAALDRAAAAIDLGRAAPWPAPMRPGDTVWMGAADARGRVVSYIQSIYWEFGSGVILPGTGVLWQNRGTAFTLTPGPNALKPGRLPFHTLNPALARLGDGRVLAYGTMGGDGQPQTQAAVFSRHVLFGRDMQAALTAPRWLLGRARGEEISRLKVESRFDPDLIDALIRAGHEVEVVDAFDPMMGHAGAIAVHPSGLIEAATDPRSDGACFGV